MKKSTKIEQELIDNAIDKFNNSQVPFTQEISIDLSWNIKDEQNTIIAGINACLYGWGIVYIHTLFVNDNYRMKGLGSKLLAKVEKEGRKLNGKLIHLDTFDFQAKDFYLKYGYEVFGILENCPAGHSRYYMKKNL